MKICECRALVAAKKLNCLLKQAFNNQFILDTNTGMWFVAELSDCYEVCAEAGCFFQNLDGIWHHAHLMNLGVFPMISL